MNWSEPIDIYCERLGAEINLAFSNLINAMTNGDISRRRDSPLDAR